MEQIIGEVIGGVLVVVSIYIAKKIRDYVLAKVESIGDDKLKTVITNLCKAADQLYKVDDPTGEIRRTYVEDGITALGYQLTEYIISMIESCVYDINKDNMHEYFDDDWTDEV